MLPLGLFPSLWILHELRELPCGLHISFASGKPRLSITRRLANLCPDSTEPTLRLATVPHHRREPSRGHLPSLIPILLLLHWISTTWWSQRRWCASFPQLPPVATILPSVQGTSRRSTTSRLFGLREPTAPAKPSPWWVKPI